MLKLFILQVFNRHILTRYDSVKRTFRAKPLHDISKVLPSDCEKLPSMVNGVKKMLLQFEKQDGALPKYLATEFPHVVIHKATPEAGSSSKTPLTGSASGNTTSAATSKSSATAASTAASPFVLDMDEEEEWEDEEEVEEDDKAGGDDDYNPDTDEENEEEGDVVEMRMEDGGETFSTKSKKTAQNKKKAVTFLKNAEPKKLPKRKLLIRDPRRHEEGRRKLPQRKPRIANALSKNYRVTKKMKKKALERVNLRCPAAQIQTAKKLKLLFLLRRSEIKPHRPREPSPMQRRDREKAEKSPRKTIAEKK